MGRLESKAPTITPGGRIGDDASHNISPRVNWVEKRGGLPRYIRIVRNGLMRKGMTESHATAVAIHNMEVWAAGGGNVSPKVQAAAAKALAQWEAMKVSKSLFRFDAIAESGDVLDFKEAPPNGGAAFVENLHPRAFDGKFRPKSSSSGSGTGGSSRSSTKKPTTLSASLQRRLPMRYGQQGTRIQSVQLALAELGFDNEQDGIYGHKTESAVMAFQKKNGIRPTGIIDDKTMIALIDNREASSRKRGKSGSGRTYSTMREAFNAPSGYTKG